MKKIGISLGWNCNGAVFGVNNGLREKKENGYLTCVFDEMVTNFPGIIKCIEEDFKYFCDTSYLELIKIPDGIEHMNKNGVGDIIIRNNYYHFLFNHESPGHGDLYIGQKWSGGINHYVDNNYTEFIKRYQRRIQNFINYLKDENNHIIFIIHRWDTNNENIENLHNVLKNKYPNLKYECYFLPIHYDVKIIKDHLEIMGIDEDDEEIKRLD
jgi:hypothetical protein